MTRAQSRKHRGYKTQALIAQRWRDNGMFPHCTDVGNGRQGNDLSNTPGLAVEIKARDTVSWPAALKQAESGKANPDDIAIVIARHNGQGEQSTDNWTVTLSLVDFELLWRGLTAR